MKKEIIGLFIILGVFLTITLLASAASVSPPEFNKELLTKVNGEKFGEIVEKDRAVWGVPGVMLVNITPAVTNDLRARINLENYSAYDDIEIGVRSSVLRVKYFYTLSEPVNAIYQEKVCEKIDTGTTLPNGTIIYNEVCSIVDKSKIRTPETRFTPEVKDGVYTATFSKQLWLNKPIYVKLSAPWGTPTGTYKYDVLVRNSGNNEWTLGVDPSGAVVDYTPYLQIYYTFDNTDTVGGNAQDLSGRNYHALSTSVTTSLTGIRNEAHGTDNVNDLINTQKAASNLNIGEATKNRTIIIWTNTTSWGTNLFLWWMGGGSGGGFGFRSDANTNLWDFAAGNAAYDIENMNIRTNNHWEMITATYNGTHLTVYANTTLVGTNKNSYSTTDTYNLAIGYSPGGSTHQGTYDDFCVWNQTLPLSAIEELYNNGAGASCLGTQTANANETQGDNAIEIAINSSVPSAVKYKSRKVYVVNATNSQQYGTADYLVVQNNPQKRWILNYITTGESYLNSQNLSNVYMLEIANKTTNQIISEVSTLINATK